VDGQEIWQTVLGEMELSVSKANFTTWFKGTRILEITDKVVTIGVPNNFTKEWLQNKYNIQISDIIRRSIPKLKKIDYRITSPLSIKGTPQPTVKINKEPSAEKNNLLLNNSQLNNQSNVIFDQKYNFENFIVGNNNRLAHATGIAIAENPGTLYNPFFIYGGVGLGKTHLVHAIGNEIKKRCPEKKILYISCENFTNEFIQSISSGKINDFKKKYRNVDVLLVDDIQFLSRKEGTQEEFFHTFNALYQTNRQIIITSDRVHTLIPDLEDRLSSRFGWGMVADVRSPNLETRFAILKSKCLEKNFELSEEVLEYIAEQINTNIRELEGALTRVITHSTLYNKIPVTISIVQEVLSDIVYASHKKITSDQILKSIVKFFNISLEDLTGHKRNKELVYPRQIAMYLLKNELSLSFPLIGRELGGKDHTTIMHGVNKIKKESANQPSIQQDLISLKEILYS